MPFMGLHRVLELLALRTIAFRFAALHAVLAGLKRWEFLSKAERDAVIRDACDSRR